MPQKKENLFLFDSKKFKHFLTQNTHVDFINQNFLDGKVYNELNLDGLDVDREELFFQIKAFQRILRIIPDYNKQVALSLLSLGIASALQIASMTRKSFFKLCSQTLSREQIEIVYQNALNKRSVILLQYMKILQNGEPHLTAAKFS